MLTYFPEIYPGELLYSMLGRLKCHSGILSPKVLLEDAFGDRKVHANAFLQAGLGRLAANIPAPLGFTALRLALETTLFPYLTAYEADEVRNSALLSLTKMNRSANAVHARIGLVASNVRLPSVLRYCLACRAKMLRDPGELYWRRDHQLPGILVCPIHGTPMFDSKVNPAQVALNEFIFADEENCPSNPMQPAWANRPEVVELLRKIAEASAALVAQPPPARSLETWGNEIRLALRARGLARGTAKIDQVALRDAYLTLYHPILDILPDARPGDWLEAIARKHRKAFAPLHHILIRLLMESLPSANASSPFGTGPWSCRNPLAEHHGQPVITDCKLHREGGKTIGVFHCSCGYGFSTAAETGSRAKILNLGPAFEERLRALVSSGTSLRGTARELHVDPNTVLRYVDLLGLETAWKGRSTYSRKPLIEREEMRAAWTAGRAAAPELTRQQLRRKIPAVYIWLYRNDRDWLGCQPPKASRHKPNKPLLDWQAIDLETALILKRRATELRMVTPPQQITRLALERALGQRGWLEKRMRKLPLCVALLSEETESVEEFQCRRAIWASDELLKQELPIQLWRVRRLAGLPDQCAAKVEDLLIEIARGTQLFPIASHHPVISRRVTPTL